jgi:hypothetical protein
VPDGRGRLNASFSAFKVIYTNSSRSELAQQIFQITYLEDQRMIHLQMVSREGANLQSLVRSAINDGQIKSFAIARVKGGLVIKHKKHIGEISLDQTSGPLLATLKCKNRTKEWQLLEAFVGRLAYHFKNDISAVNIQFEPESE